MATLAERVGDRALARAIEALRAQGVRVDETPYFRVDDRFCLVKALDYAWQWIVDMVKATGACLEKSVIRPLFCNAALRCVVPLFASRGDDPTSGLNAFLHLSGITEVMLSTFGSLEYAFQRMPVFAQRVRDHVGDLNRAQLRGPLETAFAFPEVKAVLRDPEMKRQMIAHLQRVKEWELFLKDCKEVREAGDVLSPHFGRFMSEFVRVGLQNVDVVELFHHVICGLPYHPSFFGFEVERATEVKTGIRFVPSQMPQICRARDELGRGLARSHRFQSMLRGGAAQPATRRRDPSLHQIQLSAKPSGMISLSFTPGDGVGFDRLKRQYFFPPVESVRWSSRSGRPLEMRVFDQVRYFEQFPTDVYFPIRRLRQDKRGHEAGKLTFHRDHLHVPLETMLPKRMGCESIDRHYSLKEFIAFLGDVEKGHYAYYKKEGNQWFECIDARTRLVSEREIRQILNDRSVLHHFKAS